MKTGLLKKLRKQAEDRYTIEYYKGTYYAYCYDWGFRICFLMTKNRDEAVEKCEGLRRDYILSKIDTMKVEMKKKIIY